MDIFRVAGASVVAGLLMGAQVQAQVFTNVFDEGGEGVVVAPGSGVCTTCEVAARGRRGGIPFGAFTAFPKASLAVEYDDNLFKDATGEKDAWSAILGVGANLILDVGPLEATTQLGTELALVGGSTDDNYGDFDVGGGLSFEIGPKSRVNVSAEYVKSHDPRGTGRSEGAGQLLDSPDRWHTIGAGGVLSIGSRGAKGRLDLEVQRLEKNYDNHETATREREHDDNSYGATFYWRVMPKTSLLFQARQTDVNYTTDPAGASLDSSNRDFLVGATWQATARTTGTFKIGRREKQFDEASRDDFSGVGWDLGVTWKPRTYSVFAFGTSRSIEETNGTSGDAIDSKDFSASWNHAWRKRLSSNVHLGYGMEDYLRSPREDDRYTAGAALNYQMRRWLTFGAGYDYSERDSNDNTFDYDDNLFRITVNAAL